MQDVLVIRRQLKAMNEMGIDLLKGKQRKAIMSFLTGRDTFAVLPKYLMFLMKERNCNC